MPASKAEQVLGALRAVLETVPGALLPFAPALLGPTSSKH
jgi:hypothetical protein